MSEPVPVAEGDRAPDFVLRDQHGHDVQLAGFVGQKAVLLVFYPFAFSGICTGELTAIRDDLGRFQNEQVQVLAISCDPMFTLRAWSEAQGYDFPLLSDFWPHGDVARRYGVFREDGGFATRGTFLLDRAGVLRWSLVNGPGEARDLSGYHEALAALA
ncbi:MAG TPA: peroxiredoxin [Segeticoccus sp.]|uniref:peroxiredoxin n=1 Tax=Segeticoccus sp. TaxID=2706531 RepID=UPI002D8084A2|nr:peroxiredoxin [Segeticoccus sp.]HET8602267.1 peroxiredoxin [Segeticoccus sp.]